MEQPNETLGDKLKQDVEGATSDIKARSGSVLHNEKARLVHGLHGVANALDKSADQLRQQNDANVASYLELASDKLDQASQYLENANARAILRDVESMARRNPWAVFGGMFLAGIGMAGVLRNASAEEPKNESVEPSTQDSITEEGHASVVRQFQAS